MNYSGTGQLPSRTRAWGDGAEDKREHVIEDISNTEGWVTCRCGVTLRAAPLLLNKEWDVHRGLEYRPPAYGPLATDSEVEEFLRKVENPEYQSIPSGGALVVTRDGLDVEEVEELLDRLKALQSACTCTPGSDITLCPNYDEEIDGD